MRLGVDVAVLVGGAHPARADDLARMPGVCGQIAQLAMKLNQVMEASRDSPGFFWNAQTSQICRELDGLEARGWATSRIVPQAGRPDRRVYSITAAGRAELRTWLAGPFPTQAREPLLMQAFFMAALPPEASAQRLGELRTFAQGSLDGLDAAGMAVEHYAPRAPGANDALFWDMTVDFGRRYARMIADWSADCQGRLERMRDCATDAYPPA